jgi:hypothetical protein
MMVETKIGEDGKYKKDKWVEWKAKNDVWNLL